MNNYPIIKLYEKEGCNVGVLLWGSVGHLSQLGKIEGKSTSIVILINSVCVLDKI
jgi:hypothetical protein